MKVRALINFNDYKENKHRGIGDEFEVSEDRLEEILTKGGRWVEIVEDKDMTISEIKEALREKGIEFDNKAKKAELLELLGE